MSKNKGSKHVVVDVECNGPLIGTHSMTEFGLVIVEPGLKRTFHGKLKPISNEYVPEALAVSGRTHEECMKFPEPEQVMKEAAIWLANNVQGKPIFWSDNNGFDASWMNWYFLKYNGQNPFGHSSRRIADLICGVELDLRFQWKGMRTVVHDHNPVNDAKGNAGVLLNYFINDGIKYL